MKPSSKSLRRRATREARWHITLDDLGKLRRQMVKHLHVTAFLTVPKDHNVLNGEREIAAYLRLRHPTTLQRLIEKHGFPVVPASDGSLMTTCTLIDQWMWLQSQLKVRNRPLTLREKQRLKKVDQIRQELGMQTPAEARDYEKGPEDGTPRP